MQVKSFKLRIELSWGVGERIGMGWDEAEFETGVLT